MSNITLEKVDDVSITGCKRQQLPCRIKWKCSGCSLENVADYTEGWYIDEHDDMNNEVHKQKFYCENENGCNGEVTVHFRVKIVVELESVVTKNELSN